MLCTMENNIGHQCFLKPQKELNRTHDDYSLKVCMSKPKCPLCAQGKSGRCPPGALKLGTFSLSRVLAFKLFSPQTLRQALSTALPASWGLCLISERIGRLSSLFWPPLSSSSLPPLCPGCPFKFK